MKASELIKHLEKAISTYGDLDVHPDEGIFNSANHPIIEVRQNERVIKGKTKKVFVVSDGIAPI
jgi:hypothetical protein